MHWKADFILNYLVVSGCYRKGQTTWLLIHIFVLDFKFRRVTRRRRNHLRVKKEKERIKKKKKTTSGTRQRYKLSMKETF